MEATATGKPMSVRVIMVETRAAAARGAHASQIAKT
jgi:hypothetical protein